MSGDVTSAHGLLTFGSTSPRLEISILPRMIPPAARRIASQRTVTPRIHAYPRVTLPRPAQSSDYSTSSPLPSKATNTRSEPPSPIQGDIPRPTLRSLFALHDEARGFITLDNLDQAIETAFASSNHQPWKLRIESKAFHLDQAVKQRQQASKLRPADRAEEHMMELIPSTRLENQTPRQKDGKPLTLDSTKQEKEREHAIKAALYGMEPSGSKLVEGLEGVEEAKHSKLVQHRLP